MSDHCPCLRVSCPYQEVLFPLIHPFPATSAFVANPNEVHILHLLVIISF